MARIEAQIEIAAAPADVFRFCHDVTHRAEWDERVSGVEMLSPAPVRQGTLLSVDASRGGRYAFSWDAEYAEFKYPSNSTIRVLNAAPSSPYKAGTESWSFGSTGAVGGGTTRFKVVWEYEPRNIVARITDAVMGRASNGRALRRSLANLKALLESR
jgi:hypothetical protein